MNFNLCKVKEDISNNSYNSNFRKIYNKKLPKKIVISLKHKICRSKNSKNILMLQQEC